MVIIDVKLASRVLSKCPHRGNAARTRGRMVEGALVLYFFFETLPYSR